MSGCDILVATPGRLYDHLGNQNVKDAFRELDTLVLDEADRLLDMGFLGALKDIVRCLPDKVRSNRQGMLFSTTIAPHVYQVANLVLSPGYKFIKTLRVYGWWCVARLPPPHIRLWKHTLGQPTMEADPEATYLGTVLGLPWRVSRTGPAEDYRRLYPSLRT